MPEFNSKNIDRARKTGEFKRDKPLRWGEYGDVVPLFDWNDPFTLRELIARLQQQLTDKECPKCTWREENI